MKRRLAMTVLAGLMFAASLTGCGSSVPEGSAQNTTSAETSTEAETSDTASENASEKPVLRVGMECAYAPFNWTQDADSTPDGSKAVPIYDSSYYAYGYDVAIAQMLADELDMDLEIHKVEWSSIGISMDAGDYDCIIAGMGRTAERQKAYNFTEPYYYRDNCIVVKKDGPYSDVKGLSELNGTGCVLTTQLGCGWIPLLDQVEGAVTGTNFETTSECFMAVSNGVADVFIVDVPTAESAILTNDDLKMIRFDENDTFTGDEEMVNVCIATRKDDTELCGKLQGAMDAIGWNDKEKMDKLMEKVLTQQPAAN
ncbi:transporter substrate-binding domain-containing protein [Oribacterium sp. WCC10]|uniref:transporter substrate-binding domain-containing protein n=1 Tax=Oribacterium sp. WCC10 TaxID=1855343 RepID=UPI0008ECF704|nr:transporter substrate-binding domain-containing protein [Oribacterium sp. WCC10]SFG21892.1 putative lysine transport system substrate-binding protein [Oribacterium sp. WCC10]